MSDAPPDSHFDVIVIGGGPAGYGAALYGSAAGLNIAVVEKDKVGGTCLHRGCIPAKELLETAHVFRTVSEAAKFGVESSAPSLAFATTMARKREVVTGLFNGLSGLLKNRKVTVFGATGTLAYSYTDGFYSAIDVTQRFAGDVPEANALVLSGVLDGKATLAVSLRGTDQLADWADYSSFTQHYQKFALCMATNPRITPL